jgi:hypothetical protein
MMTSNVFGHIAARNIGYAKVELQQTIARGHDGCRVVIYLQPRFRIQRGEGVFPTDKFAGQRMQADSSGDGCFRNLPNRQADGTGLGLPLVGQIVSAHRGTIDYVSEPGKGTTFSLSLPVR